MTSIVRDVLPEVIPDERIRVEEETHTFRAEKRDDGSTYRQKVYTLDKAPALDVREVSGTVDGEGYVFTEGTDYDVINNKEQIDFSIGGEQPDDNTEFYVTYVCQSIIDRYIEAHEEVLDDVEDKRTDAIFGKFVDKASGQDLDELGKAFGKLGKRRGRSDQEYRIFLKSIVQSFTGRGRVQDIRFAVAAAFGLNAANFSIKEDFDNLEYTIELDDWPAHTLATVVELTDIADPSVVKLAAVEYNIDADEMGVDDAVNTTISTAVSSEDVGIDDNVLIDDDVVTALDETGVQDNTSNFERVSGKALWNGQNVDWDFFEWAALEELQRTLPTEEVGATDDAFVDRNKVSVAGDDAGVSDAVFTDPNRTSVADQAGATDATQVDQNKTTAADQAGAADAVQSVTVTAVAWNDGDWDTMNWAREHN